MNVRGACLLFAALFWFSPSAWAVDLATGLIAGGLYTKPTIMFSLDDSGSMDAETLIDGYLEGVLEQGQLVAYPGVYPSPDFSYIRFTAEYAYARSPTYNSLYYDPAKTYLPWSAANIAGTDQTFSDASPNAAMFHPLEPARGTLNLTADQTSPESYYPATVWLREDCAVDGVTCANVSPPGVASLGTLKRYEIRGGNPMPSGRSFAEEKQNFANWFQYYRSRKLMLAASMGRVFDGLRGARVGLTYFNSTSVRSPLDLDATSSDSNGKRMAGYFYTNPAVGETPTHKAMSSLGAMFADPPQGLVQNECQKSAAVVVTDGYSNGATVPVAAYDRTKWGGSTPYASTFQDTLADIALRYFTTNLRPTLPAGKVPVGDATQPGADTNPDPHLNTYAITLGSKGTLWPSLTDPYVSAPNWAGLMDASNRIKANTPQQIDDLWHATINGRGLMFRAGDADSTVMGLQGIIAAIMRVSTQTAYAIASPDLKATDNDIVYSASFNASTWAGELTALRLADATLGATQSTAVGSDLSAPTMTKVWSASDLLTARAYTDRLLVSYKNNASTTFDAVTSSIQPVTGPLGQLKNYLQGDRSNEGTLYRKRASVLGVPLNAEPVVTSNGLVLLGASDGFLHVFNKNDGKELFAYAPSAVLNRIGLQALPGYTVQALVDGTPVVADIVTGSVKEVYAVAGLGAGGHLYYGLKLTSVTSSVDLNGAKSAVLWEFPKASNRTSYADKVGLTAGKPIIVKVRATAADNSGTPRVLVSSGYNPILDTRGRLFVLNIESGEVEKEIETESIAGGDIGLTHISAFVEPGRDYADFAYAGDLKGNLWKFDLINGTATKLATLTDPAGVPQPVTTAPELASIQGKRVVFVGTGRLLNTNDFANSQTQTIYAISDEGAATIEARTNAQIVSNPSQTNPVNWATMRGWRIDLPPGQRISAEMAIAYGKLVAAANAPKDSVCGGVSSYAHIFDVSAGLTELGGYRADKSPAEAANPSWIADSMATKGLLVRTPGTKGVLNVVFKTADGTTKAKMVSPAKVIVARRSAWREVRRWVQ